MAAPNNRFKSRMAAGDTVTACWLGMADAYVASMAGRAGWDLLVIDGEHAPNDIRSILAQLQALEASDSDVMVRLPVGQTHLIKQALDIGAQNLLIPMVETADQARDLVAAVRYPPVGRRGVGAALARASGFTTVPDYIETADDQICLFVQVENRAGLASLDEILAIDGVDGVFIGPADLAADMGFGANSAAPEVRAAIKTAMKKIQAAGKATGILTLDAAYASTCRAMGVQMIANAIDVVLYVKAMQAAAAVKP
ncbi:HpcH/HpaI aldolase family protein [Algirhabdus cladophorae]|uniref:HpcH/HpaI aldolase family protein n=1 Tax=Algirhabdus cladophorae TaxID=3377108 RepID=UPI003B849DF3